MIFKMAAFISYVCMPYHLGLHLWVLNHHLPLDCPQTWMAVMDWDLGNCMLGPWEISLWWLRTISQHNLDILAIRGPDTPLPLMFRFYTQLLRATSSLKTRVAFLPPRSSSSKQYLFRCVYLRSLMSPVPRLVGLSLSLSFVGWAPMSTFYAEFSSLLEAFVEHFKNIFTDI